MRQLDKKRARVESSLDKLQEKYQNEAGKRIYDVVLYAIKEWHQRFPKRKVHFMDAMGVVCIWIDGVEVSDYIHESAKGSVNANRKRAALMQPLEDIRMWYIEISDKHHIAIEDIKVS